MNRTMQSTRLILALCTVALMVCSVSEALAQDIAPIEIVLIKQIDFGVLQRGTNNEIGYGEDAAAELEITGTGGMGVSVAVSIAAPAQVASNGTMLDVALAPSVLGYSLDEGMTWRQCTSATMTIQTMFPDVAVGLSKILVRVGAIANAEVDQKRGRYVGSLRVQATYFQAN